nr:E3 ubiquitin-protein ligase RNF4 isoform X3 [Callorhinus ursinus]
MALEAEPIELVESAGDEIVDLTCESLEPVVVDLTHNDSVVIVDERRRPRRNARRPRQDHADSCVVSSDDEELSRDRDVYVTTHTPRNTREEAATGLRPSGTVSCPICMDGYSEPQQKLLVLPVAPEPSGTAPDLRRPVGSGVWGPSNPLGPLLPGECLLPLLAASETLLVLA